MKSAIERGDTERFLNIWAEAQEANWTKRKALLDVGARDSLLCDFPSPPDDEDLIDTDALDLAALPLAVTGEEDE